MKPSRILVPACLAGAVLLSAATTCRAQALSGWTSGSPLDRRPLVPVSAFSSSPYVPGIYGSLAPPIFMTTIHYPGQYGAYSYANGAIVYPREPRFYPSLESTSIIPAVTTTVEPFRRLDTPAGAATLYANPPVDVPTSPGSTTLTTVVPREPALPVDEVAENTARVVVRLPEEAQLEFQGIPIPGSGRVRKYTTPPLPQRKDYHYDVRAIWRENGRDVVQERRVTVYPGARVDIDFIAPPPETSRERELRTEPLRSSPTTPPRP
jgi:uncharacterized protein (TIGR03000 family)